MRTLDHAACARAIFESIGGGENLASAAHCATRLRLVVADAHKVDQKRLESIPGVMGVFCAGGQLQIILGTGTVNRVYEEFIKLSGLPGAPAAQKCTAPVLPLPQRLVKTLGDVFVPILPAIVAAGLLTGILDALGRALPTVAAADWFSFLKMVSGTAFVSLPVLVALSSARVFGGNLFLGGVVGLCMVHPALLNAWSVGTAENVPVWHLLCFNVKQVGYQGHVIPVIMAVWLMSRLERWFRSRVPAAMDLFVTPLCTVLITTFVTFTILGPCFSFAENCMIGLARQLSTVGHGIGALVMGALYPVTVVCGLHHMYNVIEAGLLSAGSLNIWMPIASAANFAQCGACLAVAFKTRDPQNKTVAIPSALSAALGITEPAIFGVNLRYVRPFVCAMVGGAVRYGNGHRRNGLRRYRSAGFSDRGRLHSALRRAAGAFRRGGLCRHMAVLAGCARAGQNARLSSFGRVFNSRVKASAERIPNRVYTGGFPYTQSSRCTVRCSGCFAYLCKKGSTYAISRQVTMSAPVPQTSVSTTSPTWMGACSTTLSSAATTSAICPLGTGLEVLTGQRECRHPSARTVLVMMRVGWVSSSLP